MRIGLRPDNGQISRPIETNRVNPHEYLRRELAFLVRDVAMRNEPERWQAAHRESMADVGATIKDGTHTIEEWIEALQ